MMHIGLIGGIGPAATDFYLRGLIAAHARSGTRLALTIAYADATTLTQNLARGADQAQAAVFLPLIEQLAAAGARAVAVTSMGGHFCIGAVQACSPLPIINAIPLVAGHIAEQGYRRIGVLGTRKVMESRLYGALNGVEVLVPHGAALEDVHNSYVAMAIAGRVTAEQRSVFLSAGAELCREQGAEAVMLGGTDLFLAVQDTQVDFPLIDCAAIHVQAIHDYSLAE